MFASNQSGKYLLGEDKILIVNNDQSSIHEYNVNDKNELNLELILQYDNVNDKNLILKQIREDGFSKFRNYLLFDNDTISPIFNLEQKKIGMAYKYPVEKDQIDYNAAFKMRKIFTLYMNYKKMNTRKNNIFLEYYMVNKDWIQMYKNFYDFDILYKEIEKNKNINDVINSIINDESNNNFISDKKLTLMIKSFPKVLINKFIQKDNSFEKNYEKNENKVQKNPLISSLNYIEEMGESQTLFHYINFEIVESEIYKNLFENIDKNHK